jgi:hypothetical protein
MKMIFHPALALASIGLSGCALIPAAGGAAPSSFTARIGQTVRSGGVAVTPLSVIEDSRCPLGVQCIQAGTVRLSTRISRGGQESEVVVGLRKPAAIGSMWLHLDEAFPYPRQPGPIAPGNYSFSFTIDGSAGS